MKRGLMLAGAAVLAMTGCSSSGSSPELAPMPATTVTVAAPGPTVTVSAPATAGASDACLKALADADTLFKAWNHWYTASSDTLLAYQHSDPISAQRNGYALHLITTNEVGPATGAFMDAEKACRGQ